MLKGFQVHRAAESSNFADDVESDSDEMLFWQEDTLQYQPVIGEQPTEEQVLKLQLTKYYKTNQDGQN